MRVTLKKLWSKQKSIATLKNKTTHNCLKVDNKMRHKPDIEDALIEILKKGAKNPAGLHKITQQIMKSKGNSCSEATYFRHLEKLIKRGDIEKIEVSYSLPHIEKQADSEEIEIIIGYLKNETDEHILQIYCQDFWRLFETRRGAHLQMVLPFIEISLVNSKFASPKILKNFVRALYVLLAFEKRKRKTPDKNIIAKITENIKTIEGLVRESPDNEFVNEVLFFLAETGDEKAINIIFDLVETLPDDRYNDLQSNITNRLFTSEWTLFDNHKELIIKNILGMIKHSNPAIKKRGLELHSKKQGLRIYE